MRAWVAAAVQIATFDGERATTWPWQPVNDPVMGGQSTATFRVDAARSVGVWEGEVAVVPLLDAPGFCNLQAPGMYKTAKFPDISGTAGLVARFTGTGLTQYRVMLESKGAQHSGRAGSYGANLTATSSMADHFVPWSAFKCTWRGQDVDWCPELTSQLAQIDSIGFGTAFPGKAGAFHAELESLSAREQVAELAADGLELATVGGADGLELATFDGSKHKWHTENDPVMGGQSTASFSQATGDYQGSCRIVPKLSAPGFTILMTEAPLFGSFPDVSGYDGLTITGKNIGGNVTTFKIAFCDSHFSPFKCQFGSFKAEFSLPAGSEQVFVPWAAFSDKWSSATGKHTSEDPPTASSLKTLTQLQIWVEGVAGDFHLRLASVAATKKPTELAAEKPVLV